LCLERSADLLLDLRSLVQVMHELDRQYTDELKEISKVKDGSTSLDQMAAVRKAWPT